MNIKTLTITLSLALLSLCTMNAQSYKVSGDIKGLDVDKGYMFIEDPSAERGFRVDSINITDGKFEITREIKNAEVLRMSFRSDKLMKKVGRGYIPTKSALLHFIAFPDADVKIKGEATDFCNFYPYGDAENEWLTKLHKALYPLMNESVNLYLETFIDTAMADDRKKEIEVKSEAINEKMIQYRSDFLNEHVSSIAGLWLMEDMIIRSQIEIEKVAELMDKVDAKYKDLLYYTKLAARVKGFKETGVGMTAPAIKGTNTLDGKEFNIKSLRGKYVIIDFWGTWCGACIAGVPEMKKFRDEHKEILQIVGLAKDNSVEKVNKLMEKKGMNWPNILIGKGEQDYVAKYNVQGYPTKILLDRNGKILLRSVGETEGFYEEVEKLLGK